MDLLEIATMARELMDFHGLQDWIFKFNRSKYKKYGNCCYSLKTINITSFYSFREASYDSREWGSLRADKIVGKVWLRLAPVNKAKAFFAPNY